MKVKVNVLLLVLDCHTSVSSGPLSQVVNFNLKRMSTCSNTHVGGLGHGDGDGGGGGGGGEVPWTAAEIQRRLDIEQRLAALEDKIHERGGSSLELEGREYHMQKGGEGIWCPTTDFPHSGHCKAALRGQRWATLVGLANHLDKVGVHYWSQKVTHLPKVPQTKF